MKIIASSNVKGGGSKPTAAFDPAYLSTPWTFRPFTEERVSREMGRLA